MKSSGLSDVTVRQHLEACVTHGTLQMTPGTVGGKGGTTPNVYYLAEPA
jgi:hypothetical protein